jgi:phosphatidylserine decarboxylase
MLWNLLATNLLWSQGQTILLFIIAIAILTYLIYKPFYYLTVFFFLFSLWFFRNPERHCPELQYDKTVIVCPADGKIVDIQFGDVGHGFDQKVSISLSLFDVHVNWMPVSGTIYHSIHTPGAFTIAYVPKSSELNERHDLFIKTADGKRVMVRQIAGIIARRICWWVHENQTVKAGDAFGMIRFGSRVELFLPKDVTLSVGCGQLVYGGQTVIGHWSGAW